MGILCSFEISPLNIFSHEQSYDFRSSSWDSNDKLDIYQPMPFGLIALLTTTSQYGPGSYHLAHSSSLCDGCNMCYIVIGGVPHRMVELHAERDRSDQLRGLESPPGLHGSAFQRDDQSTTPQGIFIAQTLAMVGVLKAVSHGASRMKMPSIISFLLLTFAACV